MDGKVRLYPSTLIFLLLQFEYNILLLVSMTKFCSGLNLTLLSLEFAEERIPASAFSYF